MYIHANQGLNRDQFRSTSDYLFFWGALSPAPHPTFLGFVCPVVSRSERRLVELRILFQSIWKLSRRRRFSSDPLEPITETAFEDLRASIQESKGRLVSL
ncbi:BQ2448_6439 [Microbotryum intermedium]|uniref:BQ2448_6439 protein n=1 Tax=Microbotryum intermedium TaxID=269621 RepID=A0A238FL73_9BASI|nr:BQ2448_6439 [Microbotryum intermedium]